MVQLKNTVTELNYGVLQQLHEELELMKTCKGRQECALRSTATRSEWSLPFFLIFCVFARMFLFLKSDYYDSDDCLLSFFCN